MPEESFETPQPTQPTEPIVETKRTNWPKVFLVTVLGLGLLAGSAYAGYYYGIQQVQQTEKPTPVVSQPSPTPSVEDETRDWKTYNVSQYAAKYGPAYRFSVKYPSDWQSREHDSGTGFDLAFLSPDYQTPQKGAVEEISAGGRIEIFIYPNQAFSKLENWFADFYSRPYLHSISKEPQQVSIAAGDRSYQGLEFELIGSSGLDETVHAKVFAIGDTVYLFKAVFKENATKYMSVLDQILSTFKFIEAEDQTKDWQTYRNEQYGFEFRYPQNFQVTEGLGQYFLNQKPVIELKSESLSYLQNIIDAYFTVSVKSNAKAECEYVPRGVIDTLQNKEINGVSFTMFSASGVATGNTYSNTILHYLRNTTCYEVVTTIHEASDGSTPEASSKINERETILENQLDQILSTFKFLD